MTDTPKAPGSSGVGDRNYDEEPQLGDDAGLEAVPADDAEAEDVRNKRP